MNNTYTIKRLLHSSAVALIAIAMPAFALLANPQETNQQKAKDTILLEQQTIDGIIATVNDDIISFKDVAGELLIQNKLKSEDCSIDEILQRIIEDLLIFQELSKYPPAPLLSISIDVNEERASIASTYGGENNLKLFIYTSGLTPEDLSDKLRYKKIIYLYLNYKIFSAIYISVDEIKNYYEKNISRMQNGADDNFYKHYEEIKKNLAVEKTKSAYDDYIHSLKQVSVIIVRQEIVTELKKRCSMQPLN